MKRINEKLIDIDLIVDIESKSGFRSEKSWFGGKVLESSPPIKSHSQYLVLVVASPIANVDPGVAYV